jgi:hypothetical protein
MDFNIDLHGLEDVLSGNTSNSTEVPVLSISDMVSLSDIESTLENSEENKFASDKSSISSIEKEERKETIKSTTKSTTSLSVEDIRKFYADDKTSNNSPNPSHIIEKKKETTESVSKKPSLTVEEIRKIYGIQEEKKEEIVLTKKETIPVKEEPVKSPSFTAEDIRRIYGIQEEKKEEPVMESKKKETPKQSSLSVEEIRKIYGISSDNESNIEENGDEEEIEEEYDEEEDYDEEEIDEEEIDEEDYDEEEEDYSDDEVDEEDLEDYEEEEDYSDDEVDEEEYEEEDLDEEDYDEDEEEDFSDDEIDEEEYEEVVKNEKPVLEKAKTVSQVKSPEIDISSVTLPHGKKEEVYRQPVVESRNTQQVVNNASNNDILQKSSLQNAEKTKACYEASTVKSNIVKTMPKINYSSLEISKLYNFVAVFMKRNGVKSSGIRKSVLVEEFGADNIKRLITKSYLIQLADGTLTFSV